MGVGSVNPGADLCAGLKREVYRLAHAGGEIADALLPVEHPKMVWPSTVGFRLDR